MSSSDAAGAPGFVGRLAVFGGQPRSARTLHVGRPDIGDRAAVLARVGAALDRRWLTNDGPLLAGSSKAWWLTGWGSGTA